jgi:hypothetical protein
LQFLPAIASSRTPDARTSAIHHQNAVTIVIWWMGNDLGMKRYAGGKHQKCERINASDGSGQLRGTIAKEHLCYEIRTNPKRTQPEVHRGIYTVTERLLSKLRIK